MTLSRRGFLGALLAASAAPAIVRADSLMKLYTPPGLILWGDGVHDDTLALQALLDGKDVRSGFSGVARVDPQGGVLLSNGVFRLSSTLILRSNTAILSCDFRGLPQYQSVLLARDKIERVTLRDISATPNHTYLSAP